MKKELLSQLSNEENLLFFLDKIMDKKESATRLLNGEELMSSTGVIWSSKDIEDKLEFILEISNIEHHHDVLNVLYNKDMSDEWLIGFLELIGFKIIKK